MRWILFYAEPHNLSRINAYTYLADLVGSLRLELSAPQLLHVVELYSELMHYPYCPAVNQGQFSRAVYSAFEALAQKDSQAAIRAGTASLECMVDRLEALAASQPEIVARLESYKSGEPEPVSISFIEKARTFQGAFYAVDKPDAVAHGKRCLISGSA